MNKRTLSSIFAALILTMVLPSLSSAHDIQLAAKEIRKMPLVSVTPSIYVIHGMLSLPTNDNGAFVNNPGFVIMPEGVVVIDPGSSTDAGEILMEHIRNVTDKPVVAVINTHVHGDHWFGNHAVRKAFPDVPIYAHEKSIQRLINGEDQDWFKLFTRLAPQAMASTEIVRPNMGLKGGEALDLGGGTFNIIYPVEKAHTDTDIFIEVPTEKTLFLGDIVMNHRTFGSRMNESLFAGIEEATRIALDRPNIEHYVPGHGPVGGRDMVEHALKFVATIRASVKKHYDAGETDFEMKDKVLASVDEYKTWYGFDELGRAISYIYLEAEAQDFESE
ncbi:MAG: MBL fold metallo-hydrolase [Magnetovibrio sp.]|nr:MBL fold metallo-hydrolase [Magnetovibrio sp.]